MELQPTLADYQWLVSDATELWLQRAAEQNGSLVRLTTDLRRELTAVRTHLVLEQTELRRRGEGKFLNSQQMFFGRRGLEQATGERIAAYKAQRFHTEGTTADLCCGIGGDLLSLARRCHVVAVDRCATMALFAEANCRRSSVEGTRFLQCSVSAGLLEEVSQWHLDPDRRVHGRRATRMELYDPGPETIASLLAANPNGAVKLAPAAQLPDQWQDTDTELEWVSDGKECKQLIAWFGKLARSSGLRSATCVGQDGKATSLTGPPATPISLADRIGDFIYEPDPAVLAAGLAGQLAQSDGLQAVANRCGYLTGPAGAPHPLRTSFEVEEVLPFDIKRLKALLRTRHIGAPVVKKRGVDIDPAQLARQLASTGERPGTVLIMPHAGKVCAVLAQRSEG